MKKLAALLVVSAVVLSVGICMAAESQKLSTSQKGMNVDRDNDGKIDLFYFNNIIVFPKHRKQFILNFLRTYKQQTGNFRNPVHCVQTFLTGSQERNDKDNKIPMDIVKT